MLHTLLEAVKFAGSLPNLDFVVNTGDHPMVDLPGKRDGGDGGVSDAHADRAEPGDLSGGRWRLGPDYR